MQEIFTTNPQIVIGSVVVVAAIVAAGGYAAYAWLQQKWPFVSK
jgi:hypothetical protein